ncbi:unnamed protein product, partial [Onchocerca flexuosa]|uniref:MHD domain-containing protein n=1 Tax=Onchocerca flexuosa TaxID=387005 RepID=A0A183HXV5_9BILA
KKKKKNGKFKSPLTHFLLLSSLLKFAVEKEQPAVAHVKLLLCNNSNHQLQWILKCTDNAIKAEPMMSGQIGMLGTDQVNLMWQRPKNINIWTDLPSPKLQLFIKLIAVTTGAEITDASAKFKGINSTHLYLFQIIFVIWSEQMKASDTMVMV